MDKPSDAMTLEQAMVIIRSFANFTAMKSALNKNPEKFAAIILSFIGKSDPMMADAVKNYGADILRAMYDNVQVFVQCMNYFRIHSVFFR